jgi:drug/metabolite transporter (DMT)-like permease
MPAATAAPAAPNAAAPTRGALVLAFATVYLVWGSTYLAIHYVLESMPPFLSGGSRFLLAGAVLLAWAAWADRGKPHEAITGDHWKMTTLIGALLFLGGNGAVMWAQQRVPSGIAALLVAIMPCWLALLEWLGPARKVPSLLVVLGLVMGTVGLALLVGLPSGTGSVDPLAAVVLLMGSLSWAAGSLVARSPRLPRSPLRNSGMQMIGGGALLVLAGGVMGEAARFDPSRVSVQSGLAWLYLVTFGSLIAFTAFAWLMRNATPTKVATYAYVNPVVAVLLGWAFAGEPITARMLVAAAVIVGAVVMITVGKTRA